MRRKGEVVDIAYHQQVDVAARVRAATRNGAVDARVVDPSAQRFDRVAQHIGHAEGLAHERLDLSEYRAGARGLHIALPALRGDVDQTRCRQPLDLALDCALAASRLPHEFVDEPTLVRPAEQRREHPLARGAKKGIADR